ncbi:MAG: hypothetical protein KGY65_00240 [Candidatus Thermoplasmatota archaeon]|nr:hypothetical protein [Candidatus Thermoplasmatota archaeon]MBS3801160.1 hypothetical protein [Candidatus Thermoplasmatota archaeon]
MKPGKNTEGLAEGEWVLLFNNEIIDHSANVEDMLLLAQKKYQNEKISNDSVKISKILAKTNPREILLDK